MQTWSSQSSLVSLGLGFLLCSPSMLLLLAPVLVSNLLLTLLGCALLADEMLCFLLALLFSLPLQPDSNGSS